MYFSVFKNCRLVLKRHSELKDHLLGPLIPISRIKPATEFNPDLNTDILLSPVHPLCSTLTTAHPIEQT